METMCDSNNLLSNHLLGGVRSFQYMLYSPSTALAFSLGERLTYAGNWFVFTKGRKCMNRRRTVLLYKGQHSLTAYEGQVLRSDTQSVICVLYLKSSPAFP